jgi:sarcosine oxidase
MSQHKPTIVVIGLGSVGSMTAWQLAKRQEADVIGLEQYGRVHSHGSYAGESRVFRAAYHEGGLYVPLLLESRELWRELQVESGREVYLEAGTLSIAQESQPEFQTTLECVRDYDLPPSNSPRTRAPTSASTPRCSASTSSPAASRCAPRRARSSPTR